MGGGGDDQDGEAGGQPIAPCEETVRHGWSVARLIAVGALVARD